MTNLQRAAMQSEAQLDRMRSELAVMPADCAACEQAQRMFDVFGPSGGICTGDQAAEYLRRIYSQPVSRVARWIVEREVATYPWRGQIMVPLFQFVDAPLRPMTVVAGLLKDLGTVMDDWEIACWLATGNDWLDGRTPVSALLSCEERAVRWAAWAERSVVREDICTTMGGVRS